MEDHEKEPTEKQIEEQTNQPVDNHDFIQEFIERKKLQNKVLQELIDKLKQTENQNKSSNKQ